MGATLNTGDLAFAWTTRNPASSGYGWHMVTTGATGVANTALRLDLASSDQIWADAIQLEAGPVASSFIDSYQGTMYSGAIGTSTIRPASSLSFPTSGSLSGPLTVAFWMYPLWNAADSIEHVIFDLAMNEAQDRIKLTKDLSNKLVLSVYDVNGGLKENVSNSSVSFSRESWQHIAFTLNAGTLTTYLNGTVLASTPSGSGSGQITNTASSMFLGSDYRSNLAQGAVFDDFVVSSASMSADTINRMAADTGQFLGLSAASKGIDIGQGNATTSGTAGVQSSVAHGLGVTPSFIHITERSNGVVYLSAPADATNFYVTASANAVNFDWRAYA